MRRWLCYQLILMFFIACASRPTPYQKKKNDEGYIDSQMEELRVVTFKASHYTKVETAKLFAEFRAVEVCLAEGYPFANIIDIFDKSKTENVTKTDSNIYGPSYYGGFGMYPYYSRYSSIGVGVNYSNVSSSTYEETYIYPNIEVIYKCADKIFRPKLMFREVTAEQMKELVKDLRGAIQIQKVLEDSPNKNYHTNDILTHVNGVRIDQVYELISKFDDKNQKLQVTVLREGKPLKLDMKAIDVSTLARPIQEKIITDACKRESVKKLHKKKLCK